MFEDIEFKTEIINEIRAAIQSKLHELGGDVDEELSEFILLMVVNKKTSQQISDGLSLFLGNNALLFTFWLDGVFEGLRISLSSSEGSVSSSTLDHPTVSVDVSSHIKAQEESLQVRNSSSTSRNSACSSKEETSSWKPKHPASSVVQVNKATDEAQDSNILNEKGDDEKDKDPGSTTVSSQVSLPRKPECKPSLPPTKRSKRKLNVKTTSKSMGSVTKKKGCQKLPHKLERTIKSKEHSIDIRNKIVFRHISGEGYKKIAKVLDVPQSTVRSVIVKWKAFGTTKTLPRSGRPAKLSTGTSRASVRKNPTVTLIRLKRLEN